MDCCSSKKSEKQEKGCSNSNDSKKNLDYVIILVLAFLLIGSLIIFFTISSKNHDVVDDGQDLNLEKYRSNNIPEDCRLPTYETRIESWKEHLSHHQNTLYCLDYFD